MPARSERVVGICGTGQMGAAVGRKLRQAGWRVLTAGEGRSNRSRRMALDAGIDDVGSLAALAREADVVMSIMGSTEAVRFAEEQAAAIDEQGRLKLFVECNLISPRDMAVIGQRLGTLGVATLDAGIVGPPPTEEASPLFYVSGSEQPFEYDLASAGLRIRRIGPELGQASALKIYSAAVWQGCLALVAEVVEAAEAQGLGELLMDDLHAHQTLIYDWFAAALPEALPRAARWTPDMRVVSAAMIDAGCSGSYHEAASRYYASMTERHRQEGGQDPLVDLLRRAAG